MQPQFLALESAAAGDWLDVELSIHTKHRQELIMQSLKFALVSLKGRLAGAVFALVASVASFAAVVLAFASASGELDPVLAKLKAAPAASAVAAKAPARPARS